ncbi:MAG: hypothetical protein QOG59_3566 [Solirubrobacteraceae bacterium]|jgi:hypothetical protein|nr:hypothetical protein [Solirubrobacteraceae bacterium]
MTEMTWQSMCSEIAGDDVSLQQLDDELEQIPHLSQDERSAIWLYAWSSRENAALVAHCASA